METRSFVSISIIEVHFFITFEREGGQLVEL
jgi:hypothetical protein